MTLKKSSPVVFWTISASWKFNSAKKLERRKCLCCAGRSRIQEDGILLIGTRQQLSKVEPIPLRVGTVDIEPVNGVRNLGGWFDSMFFMETRIDRLCSSGFYYLHNLRGILKYLSQDCVVTLTHAFVTSRLDYCNSHTYGLPQCQISKLQRVQNAASRIALDLSKFCYITPTLRQLHWLTVVK